MKDVYAFPLKEVTPTDLRELSDQELLGFHNRVHGIFAVSNENRAEGVASPEDAIQAHLFAVQVMFERGLKHMLIQETVDDTLPSDVAKLHVWESTQDDTTSVVVPITKVDVEKRLVYGVVYEPDSVDAHDDWADAAVIEEMAHLFLREYRTVKIMHEQKVESAYVVESYIAPVDFKLAGQDVKAGSWVLVTKILDDQVWDLVKRGVLNAYSFGGVAVGRKD